MQIVNNILKDRFIKKSIKFDYRYSQLRYEDIYILEEEVLTERYHSGFSDTNKKYFIEIERYNNLELVCGITIYDYYLDWL